MLSLLVVLAVLVALVWAVANDILAPRAVYWLGTVFVIVWAVWHEGSAWERHLNRRAAARRPRGDVFAPLRREARAPIVRASAPALRKTRRRTRASPPLFGTVVMAFIVAILITSLLWGCRFNG